MLRPDHLVRDVLDQFVGQLNGASNWERGIFLYLLLTAAWAVLAALAFWMLGLTDRAVESGLRVLARALPEDMAVRSAATYVRWEGALTALRLATGLRVGPGEVDRNGSVLTSFSRRGRRWASTLFFVAAAAVPLAVWFLRVTLRRTVPNVLIWLAVAWYLGWLATAVHWAAQWDWEAVQPSQVGAVIGLAVVAWAVFARSDIRGRVEFNKTASLEGRKRLARMRVDLRTLMVAERRVRDDAVASLFAFPSEEQLLDLTGYHGLRWSHNHLGAADSCRNHTPPPRFGRLGTGSARLPRRTPVPASSTALDEGTTKAVEALKKDIRELRDQGYWYKVTQILPATARSGLFELEWMDLPRHAVPERGRIAIAGFLDLSTAQHVKWAWELADTTEEVTVATRRAEREVRRRVARLRDYLWDGYVISARLAHLDSAIGHLRLERLVDRLKQ